MSTAKNKALKLNKKRGKMGTYIDNSGKEYKARNHVNAQILKERRDGMKLGKKLLSHYDRN